MNQRNLIINCSTKEQQWKNHANNLENQLLELRVEQINLKRINRNLQETLKVAFDKQNDNRCQYIFGINWKKKYEIEVERNIQSQKYIKVLQSKRNSLSSSSHQSFNKIYKSKHKDYQKGSQAPRMWTNNRNGHQYKLSHKQNHQNQKLSRSNSVQKMSNFMEKIIESKEAKYQVSDFDHNKYSSLKDSNARNKSKSIINRPSLNSWGTIQRIFSQVDYTGNRNGKIQQDQQDEAQQQILKNNLNTPHRLSLSKTKKYSKISSLMEAQNAVNKKLKLDFHIR